MIQCRDLAFVFRGRHRRSLFFVCLFIIGVVMIFRRDDLPRKSGHGRLHFSDGRANDAMQTFTDTSKNAFEGRDLQMKDQLPPSLGVTEIKPIRNRVPDGGDGKLHILILASQRSGSSFLGEIFKQNAEIFYAFEPVRPLTFAVLKHELKSNMFDSRATDIMYEFFTCRNATIRLVKRRKNRAEPIKIRYIDLSDICRTKRHVAIKEIRLYNIEQLQTFAEKPAFNFKIVHLIRDPRAVMNSRARAYFINHDFKRKAVPWDEVTDLCLDTKNNLNFVYSPPSWLRGKYMLVRYEDLASRPLQSAREIYDFVGLHLPENVVNWVNDHTQERQGGDLSTTRNSTERISAWKTEMTFEDAKDVQEKCSEAMQMLGYTPIPDEYVMKSVNVSLVEESTRFFEFPYIV
ncbi:carbohydrate sulfotransferase 1-like [Glandiceps talaboti]